MNKVKPSAAGYSGNSGAIVGAGSTDKTKIHEPFHLLGFDEGYNPAKANAPNPGMSEDIMNAGEGFIYNQADGKTWAAPDFNIGAIHYINVINYVIQNAVKGTQVVSAR